VPMHRGELDPFVGSETKPSASSDRDHHNFDETLTTAFERAARAFPTNLAVSSATWEASYRDFNATANRLAHRLIALGAAVGDRVAILMEHDTPAIAVNVAIAKTGGIVFVMDPGDPVERLSVLMADAEPTILIADAENRQMADAITGDACTVLTFETETDFGPTDNPLSSTSPADVCALGYTSGATGRPKGVMYTHRQFRRNAAIHTEAMQYTERDRLPLLSTMGAGQGASGLWPALLNGATICPFPVKSKGITGLAEWFVNYRLTVYVSSASIFRTLCKAITDPNVFSGARAIRLASESVTADDFGLFLKLFPPDSIFVHTLSSSETSNIAWHRWTQHDSVPEGRIPIGTVSRNIEVSLVGNDGGPVPSGQIGEILVKSRYVAGGYWRDPALTSERFSHDLDGRGTRLVRTGDMARFNDAGLLEFCGRKDDRVKIRGNRIELADVEWALRRLPGIESAAAVAMARDRHEPMLVAFIVLGPDASWSETRLRHAVSANLPLHMVPSRFVFVDTLPIGPGGKIDREALRARSLPHNDHRIIAAAPQTETETLLADIWAEVLEVSRVGCDDDFFSFGGDSLKGAIVAAQIEASFGIAINLAEIAAHSTLADLAALIDERRNTDFEALRAIEPVARNNPMPLSLFQDRLWKIAQNHTLQMPMRFYVIVGKLDVGVLQDCLRYLVERHEILRTTFADDQPAQFIHAAGDLHFEMIDLSAAADPEGRAETLAVEQLNNPIDPARLPTIRHLLFKLRDDEHWLLRIAHPLTQDGWSFAILANELATLYEAELKGMPRPIPRTMPLQYADYAVWHRQLMRCDGPAYQEMLSWWKGTFAKHLRPLKLPFRRSKRLVGVDYRLGVIHWGLESGAAQRLDRFARDAGSTHFVVRLALFVALVADVSRRSTIVLGTNFSNRNRIATRNLVGPLTTLAPLVFSYDVGQSFRAWISSVRDCLYETEAHAEIPYEELYDALRSAGLKPSPVRAVFLLSTDLAEQQFGGVKLKRLAYPIGSMPWGCQVWLNERDPENCRVDFNANLYDHNAMRAMFDRYVRLLKIASRQPELTIGRLVALSSDNSLRRAIASYASRFAESPAIRR
jgi:amino acid adenylation domain-containing protein